MRGRIDSRNATEVEKDVLAQLAGQSCRSVVIDASDLEYISSAGLRILLRLAQRYQDLTIINVRPQVYEIFEMTGFTVMMHVERAYRTVSIDGCQVIGEGANGLIYRLDEDTIVKVYRRADALEEILHEREMARLALILGIPTAISYDVVRVGDHFGAVFELLNARSLSDILASEPDSMDWCVREFVKMLRRIHSTTVPEGKLPDMKDTVVSWVQYLRGSLPEDAWKKLLSMVEAVPRDQHMLHGDYHTKNLELQNDEVLLIDMDTLSVGNPVFELAFIFNSFAGFSETDHTRVLRYQGFDRETAVTFWKKFLSAYLETRNPEKLREVEDKARIIGYTRLIRRALRRHRQETEEGLREIGHWKEQLLDLLERTDTLMFKRNELELEAVTDNLPVLQAFIEEHLEAASCPMKAQMQISLAVEEIFCNIASYAYAPGKGNAIVTMDISGDPAVATITFRDSGVPYNPLAKRDPDTSLSAEEREIGGLGIFLTKKTMDHVDYEYRDGQNTLTLQKKL